MSAEPGGTVALVAPITTSPSPSQVNTVQLTENQAAVSTPRNAAGRARRLLDSLPAARLPAADRDDPPEHGQADAGLVPDRQQHPADRQRIVLRHDPRHERHAGLVQARTPHRDQCHASRPRFRRVHAEHEQRRGSATDPNAEYDVYALDTNRCRADPDRRVARPTCTSCSRCPTATTCCCRIRSSAASTSRACRARPTPGAELDHRRLRRPGASTRRVSSCGSGRRATTSTP